MRSKRSKDFPESRVLWRDRLESDLTRAVQICAGPSGLGDNAVACVRCDVYAGECVRAHSPYLALRVTRRFETMRCVCISLYGLRHVCECVTVAIILLSGLVGYRTRHAAHN